ncbi:MAG: hypothetical protein ABSH22_09635 [Tepidisphaeraceae bacterium]|jgi:hypothetical protein
MKKLTKHPEDMSADELAEATKRFDRPFVFEQARPMTKDERAEEQRLRNKRSRNGTDHRRISVSLEQRVLDKADALAKKSGIKRSELISRLVAAGLAKGAI